MSTQRIASAMVGAPDFGSGRTPLHIAAANGNVPVLTALIVGGANLATRVHGTCSGWREFSSLTALHLAAANGFAHACSVLIGAGIDPNVLDSNGAGPVHSAVSPGDSDQARLASFETTQTLLGLGAHANHPDEDGTTPLHSAAAYASAETVSLLLNARADPNAVDRYDRLPLHHAAAHRRIDNLQRLAPLTSNVDHPDSNGATALHAAAACGPLRSVRFLLSSGANACARDTYNRNSVDRATYGAPWTCEPEYTEEQTEIISLLGDAVDACTNAVE